MRNSEEMTRTRNKNVLQLLIHFTSWILVFGLPFMIFLKYNDTDIVNKIIHSLVIVLSLVAVFYINFFLLIERFLFQRKTSKFFLYNALLIIIVGLSVHCWQEAHIPVMTNNSSFSHEFLPRNISFLLRDFFSLILTTGLSVAVKMTGQWYKTEAERQEEDKKRTEAELTNLRQQLNPHFLFNTMNNIYALIEVSPEKAQKSMLELSKLLRYVLYDNRENLVPLERELNFISNYVELMRIRLGNEVDLKLELNVSGTDKMVAPLLFIALIENAFKHGVSPDKPSFIHISMENLMGRDLRCTIKNSYFPKDQTDQSGSGIGLENLRRRLEILYPHKHILKTEKEGETFVAELIIPLKNINES
jgi:sensor histidine kinase YesM